jgi:hypothetical protein
VKLRLCEDKPEKDEERASGRFMAYTTVDPLAATTNEGWRRSSIFGALAKKNARGLRGW